MKKKNLLVISFQGTEDLTGYYNSVDPYDEPPITDWREECKDDSVKAIIKQLEKQHGPGSEVVTYDYNEKGFHLVTIETYPGMSVFSHTYRIYDSTFNEDEYEKAIENLRRELLGVEMYEKLYG